MVAPARGGLMGELSFFLDPLKQLQLLLAPLRRADKLAGDLLGSRCQIVRFVHWNLPYRQVDLPARHQLSHRSIFYG